MKNLRDAINRTKGTAGIKARARPRPICNPCQSNAHERCPTLLGEYAGVIDSDFDCPCYRKDPDSHEMEFSLKELIREKREEELGWREDDF